MTDTRKLAPFSELTAESRRAVLLSIAWRAFAAVLAAYVIVALAEAALSLAYDHLLALLARSRAGAFAALAFTVLYVLALLGLLLAEIVISFELFIRWVFRGEHAGLRLTLFAVDPYPLAVGGFAQEPREVPRGAIPADIRRHLLWRWAWRVVIGSVFASAVADIYPLLALVILLAVPGFLAQWFIQASPPNAEFLLLDPRP